jgi:outer membrane protein TolC
MDSQKRLTILKNMLNRLTGAEPETPQASQVLEPPPSAPADPNQRRLQVLQSMLLKLQGS